MSAMPSHQIRRVCALGLLAAAMVFAMDLATLGAEVPASVPPKLTPIAASPAVISAAGAHHIPIAGLSAGRALTNGLLPGDATSVLITFIEKKKQTQWLLQVEATAPDPMKPLTKTNKITVGSGFGPPMKFESRPVPAKLQMHGPFGVAGWKKPPKSEVARAQFSMNENFLSLGMDQAAAAMWRWSKTVDFSKEVDSKVLKAVNPTLAEQRAVCGTFPALISYFEIVQHTDGLKDLLYKLVELPSLWSMIKHRGVDVNFSFGNGLAPAPANPIDWHLPASSEAYYFPWLVRLNGEPALKITLVVTSPQSPLLICGGVVGVLLEKIDDEEIYMTMRLLSATTKAGAK